MDWETQRIGSVFEMKYGKGLVKENRNNDGKVSVYGSNGVVGTHDKPLTVGQTVIIGRKGSVGEVHYSPEPCWPIDTTYFIDAWPDGFSPKYWAHFFSSLHLGQQEKSSAIPGISRKDVYDIDIPVPTPEEQRRIADKLDFLLAKVNKCKSRLERIPEILKRFRQSVLADACSGKLTEDWREENGNLSASQCIEEVRKKRLSGLHGPKKANLEDFFKQMPEQSDNIPASWIACRIGHIGEVVNGSTPSRKVESYWSGSIPWVSSGEVQNCLITETRENITQKGYDNASVKMLPKGTVLIAMIGEGKTRGQSAILEIEATTNQNIAAVVIDNKSISSRYLWYWFQFQYVLTREIGSGSAPKALNCQRVREMPFVLPPIEEQHEIVRQIEYLFGLSSAIEKRYS